MIKINLLRNLGMEIAAPAGGGGGESVSADISRQAAIKMAVILVFPALLFVYEKFNTSVLENEVQRMDNQIAEVDQQKLKFGTAAPKVEEYTREKRKIEKQLSIIRGLTKNRLREVKALDALQSLVPPRTRFKELKIDAGTVQLTGFTTSDEGVSELIRALDGSVFFSKILPKSASQVELPTGPAKRFELEFRVGKQE